MSTSDRIASSVLLFVSILIFIFLPHKVEASVSVTWSSASTSLARDSFPMVKMPNGKIIAPGGQTTSYSSTTYQYDPSTNTWAVKDSLNTGRYNHTGELVYVNDLVNPYRVLIIGGRTTVTQSTAELYNPGNNTWSYTANNMSISRAAHTSTVLANGKVLVVGGESAGAAKNNVDLYDPVNDSWSAVASISAARFSHTAELLDNGRVLITGGQNSEGKLSSTEIYDPSNDTWTAGDSLSEARTVHRMVKLSNGDVLVSGGVGTAGSPLYSTELWDEDTETWSTVDAMDYRRQTHSMTLMSDGRVLVTGGTGGLLGTSNTALSSAEVFDTTTNTWDVTDDPMTTSRRMHSAILLDSGSVLVANGLSSPSRTSSNELFTLDP